MPAEWKFKEVENLKKVITTNPVIGIVGIGGIPASQMQEMRKVMKDKIFLRVSKKSLIGLALEDGTKMDDDFFEPIEDLEIDDDMCELPVFYCYFHIYLDE